MGRFRGEIKGFKISFLVKLTLLKYRAIKQIGSRFRLLYLNLPVTVSQDVPNLLLIWKARLLRHHLRSQLLDHGAQQIIERNVASLTD